MDLFKLMGTIAIDNEAANKALDETLAKVKEVEAALGRIGGNITVSTSNTTAETATTTKLGTKTTLSDSNTLSDGEYDDEPKRDFSNEVFLGNLKTQLANIGANIGKDLLKTGWEYNANMDAYQSMLQTYLGTDEENAEAYLEELHQFAKDTPLSMADTFEQAIMLLATGTAKEDVTSVLGMLGDIAGGNTEKFSRIATAYWQIMSDNMLYAQDAGQLTEAGVPVWEWLAEYFNEIGREVEAKYVDENGDEYSKLIKKNDWTVADVMELSKTENPVTSEEIFAVFMRAVSEGGDRFGGMANYMQSGLGQIERMQDEYQITSGELFKPLYTFLTDGGGIEMLTNLLQQLGEVINWLWETLAAAGDLVSEAAQEYKKSLEKQEAAGIKPPEQQQQESNFSFWKLVFGLFKNGEESFSENSTYETDPSLNYFHNRNNLPGNVDGIGGSIGGISGLISALVTLPTAIREEVRVGAAEGASQGISGMTVTGTITTGNVRLDTGALVGQLTPRLNLTLGKQNTLAERGMA